MHNTVLGYMWCSSQTKRAAVEPVKIKNTPPLSNVMSYGLTVFKWTKYHILVSIPTWWLSFPSCTAKELYYELDACSPLTCLIWSSIQASIMACETVGWSTGTYKTNHTQPDGMMSNRGLWSIFLLTQCWEGWWSHCCSKSNRDTLPHGLHCETELATNLTKTKTKTNWIMWIHLPLYIFWGCYLMACTLNHHMCKILPLPPVAC